MAFESFSAFIYMEGHGPFVWTCYGAFFLLLGGVAWWSVHERRQVVRSQRFQQRLQASRGGDSGTPDRAGEASFQRIQSSHSESVSKP